MTQEDIREVARRQPFEPFRLILTTGATYDISHPDLIMVGKRAAIIGITTDAEQAAFDRTIKVDLLHVVAIKQLPTPPAAPTGPPASQA